MIWFPSAQHATNDSVCECCFLSFDSINKRRHYGIFRVSTFGKRTKVLWHEKDAKSTNFSLNALNQLPLRMNYSRFLREKNKTDPKNVFKYLQKMIEIEDEMGKEPKEATEDLMWEKNSEFSTKVVQFPKQRNFFLLLNRQNFAFSGERERKESPEWNLNRSFQSEAIESFLWNFMFKNEIT